MSDVSKAKEVKNNTLTTLVTNLIGNNLSDLSQNDTLRKNNSYDLVFKDRIVLSYLYAQQGIVQTLIDQPVDDAFRGKKIIKTSQLSEEEIGLLEREMDKGRGDENNSYWDNVQQTAKWGRLFGGSGLVIFTSQDFKNPFSISKLNEHSPLELYPADLWELNKIYYTSDPVNKEINYSDYPYNFYGKRIHKSYVLEYKGKQAPSIIRRHLRGWGMSEVERLFRSLNQYLKNQNVIFELLDEAKIDVYKMEGFNSSLLTESGTNSVEQRIQMSNMVKNFLNALTMDKDDEYEQKQMNFGGLSDMLNQIRQGIASDVKIPITKLFGVSSAGFNSGEDDIENYNTMVEREVRGKLKPIALQVIAMNCQKLFGFIPDDLDLEFESLRILSSEQQESVKTQKLNRLLNLYQSGLIDTETAKEVINRDDLVSVKIDVNNESFEANLKDLNLGGN